MPRVILICGQQVRETFDVSPGTSLWDITLDHNPEFREWAMPTICIFGGAPVLRDAWADTRLSGEDVAVFAELPMRGGGGGSNPLQVVLMVGIMAAAIFAGPAVAGALGLVESGALTAGGLAVSGLVSGGVMMAGSILSSMLFPTPSGQAGALDAEQTSPTYSINGSGNQARLNQPVPHGFGRMRVVPDIAAQKWAQYIGNDMYLYQVFACGIGEYAQESLSFGDVVFWRDGNIVESAYTPEAGEAYVNTVSRFLPHDDWQGSFSATGASGASQINTTIFFPDGLCTFTPTTDPVTGEITWTPASATAEIEIDYRKKGDDDWDDLTIQQITRATTDPFEWLISGSAGEIAQWEIRVRDIGDVPDSSTSGGVSVPNRKRAILKNVMSNMPSVEVQIVKPGQAVTLFPDNVDVSPNVASQELKAPDDGGDWTGPFTTNAPGTRVDSLLYNFIFPSGLMHADSSGRVKSRSVSVEIQIQPIDDNDAPTGDWEDLLSPIYTAGTRTAQRYTETCSVPLGRYLTRVRRTTEKGSETQDADMVQWESLTAIIPGSLTYDQTVIAIKIKATNVLSQNSADNFSVVQTRKLPLYDRAAKTWSEPVPTRSFAAAVSHVCKARYGGQLADFQIDLDALWSIDETLVEMGWTYDAWIDGPYVVWTLLAEMCNAVQVVPRIAGTTLSFIMDKSGRPVRHVFTPYNIVRGSFSRTFNTFQEDTPDDVLVSYLDEDAQFMQRDVQAVLPDSESRKTAQRTYAGIVSREHAHQRGVFEAACNRHRRMGCSFDTEGLGRLLNIGDVISVTHPRFRDTASGRLRAWDGKTLTVTLDRQIAAQKDISLYMAFNRPDGTPWGPVKLQSLGGGKAVFDASDYSALLLQGFEDPFSWFTPGDDRLPTVWTLQQGREFTRRYILTGVSPQSMYKYHVTGINDSDLVDAYAIPTPPWDFRGNLPVMDALPAPGSIRASRRDTGEDMLLSASWGKVPGATSYEVQTSVDGITWIRYGQVNTESVSFAVSDDVTWLRVATVRGFEQSSWTIWQESGI